MHMDFKIFELLLSIKIKMQCVYFVIIYMLMREINTYTFMFVNK